MTPLMVVTPAPMPDLPADTPVHVALDQLSRHFGDKAALIERAGGTITAENRKAIEEIGRRVVMPRTGEEGAEELRNITPYGIGFPINIGPDFRHLP